MTATLAAVPACVGAARAGPAASRANALSPCASRSAVSVSSAHRSTFLSGCAGDANVALAGHRGVSHKQRAGARTSRFSIRTSAVAATANAPAAPAPVVGAKLVPAAISIGVGLVVRFLIPCPVGVSAQAWQLLAIFLSTITGLVLEPLPVGAWSFLGLTIAILTKTLTFAQAFQSFTSDVIWLIVISFFFAKGFVKTGLGDRVANIFVAAMGKSTLGLSYGLVAAETLIAPAMPSTTARAGGVFLPIISSLSKQAGSLPGATARKLGTFLIQAQLQCGAHSSAMFMTAAAQNLLSLKLAAEVTGMPLSNPWITWFVAACVPALCCLLVTPYIVYKLAPPEIKDTPEAPGVARERLKALGPLTRDESLMARIFKILRRPLSCDYSSPLLFLPPQTGIMGLAVGLWVFGDMIGVSTVLTAMIGLCALLVTGVLSWQDCLQEKTAWDTLTWFAVLVGMSGMLNQFGLVKFLSDSVAASLAAMHLSWPYVVVLLNLVYFGMHYMFASQTAHVGSLCAAFLAVMVVAGVPPILATLTLAFNTNLFGGISHYSSGQAAVYYGAGYLDLPLTFKIGAVCGVTNLAIWGVVGGLWWKVIGLY